MMIFRRKKSGATLNGGQRVMRGRDSVENGKLSDPGNDDNPLARRFHPDDEPDTIDLQQSTRFPDAKGETHDEPSTRDLSGASSEGLSVITYVPETAKFYIHPGEGGNQAFLDDQPVSARTELRHGDRIRIGDSELHYLPCKDL